MVGVEISGALAVVLGLLGSAWIYLDARNRRMEAGDMWTVGFFVGMFVPPIIGAVVVETLYLQKRNGKRGKPSPVRRRR